MSVLPAKFYSQTTVFLEVK